MRDRLPASYQKSLQPGRVALKGGELHKAVTNLAVAYHSNYEITFPPLATPTILLQYLRELALPRLSPLTRLLPSRRVL